MAPVAPRGAAEAVKRRYVAPVPLPEFDLWARASGKRLPLSFELELTSRCNLNCRHCYINRPAGDRAARGRELSMAAIGRIADQAVEMGALWCLLTGGEPLLRRDFADIYRMLYRKGLLLSVFTNATLLDERHMRLFREFPPRDIEVTVYGVTPATYEAVSRRAGSFAAFRRGLDQLRHHRFRFRLKAMVMRSNLHELDEIAAFGRRLSRDFFRLDPLLHLRFDGDARRNAEIIAERLTPEEIAALDRSDPERSSALRKDCERYIFPGQGHARCRHLFHCGAGMGGFTVSPEGLFRLCSSLWHPDCLFDLTRGTLKEAWERFVPRVRAMTSDSPVFLSTCRSCRIINLCLWCPAHAYLETGRLDAPCGYFCDVAHARASGLRALLRGRKAAKPRP